MSHINIASKGEDLEPAGTPSQMLPLTYTGNSSCTAHDNNRGGRCCLRKYIHSHQTRLPGSAINPWAAFKSIKLNVLTSATGPCEEPHTDEPSSNLIPEALKSKPRAFRVLRFLKSGLEDFLEPGVLVLKLMDPNKLIPASIRCN